MEGIGVSLEKPVRLGKPIAGARIKPRKHTQVGRIRQ
jgi:hypothetical protein